MILEFDLERAHQGDAVATASLVEALRPRLEKMAGYYGRCLREDPDDLLQEAWLGLLEALGDVDPRIGCAEQYLLQHARWRLLDAGKRLQRHRMLPWEEAYDDGFDSDDCLPVTIACPQMEGTLERLQIETFAANLSTTQRNILQCILRGMTWRETGKLLGCTSANVAYHMRQIAKRYTVWCDAM